MKRYIQKSISNVTDYIYNRLFEYFYKVDK